jgi:arginine repressor
VLFQVDLDPAPGNATVFTLAVETSARITIKGHVADADTVVIVVVG